MSLHDWQRNGWLVQHQTSAEEIRNLLAIVDRDLAECRIKGLSADWRLNIAYNAALQAATAALAASGYRAGRESHHFRIIQSLAYTINADPEIMALFDRFRKKRNITGYDLAGMVSVQEALAMERLAQRLRQDVVSWLEKYHSDLLSAE